MKRIKALEKRMVLWIINNFLSCTRAFAIKRFLLNKLVYDVSLDKNVKVVGPIYLNGSLKVGKGTWIGHDFRLEGNGQLTIGSNCDIAPLVTCFTGSHEIGSHDRRAGKGYNGVIIIGNGVWIGGRTTILANSIIKDGSVIAAGSCVNKFVEEDCLVGGVPAKIIKSLS